MRFQQPSAHSSPSSSLCLPARNARRRSGYWRRPSASRKRPRRHWHRVLASHFVSVVGHPKSCWPPKTGFSVVVIVASRLANGRHARGLVSPEIPCARCYPGWSHRRSIADERGHALQPDHNFPHPPPAIGAPVVREFFREIPMRPFDELPTRRCTEPPFARGDLPWGFFFIRQVLAVG